MKGKSPIAGLIVLSSVLLVAAGLFGALFLVNRADPASSQCLAAAHLLANTINHSSTVSEGSGMAVAAEFEQLCSTATSS